jgi:hypothetical protein
MLDLAAAAAATAAGEGGGGGGLQWQNIMEHQLRFFFSSLIW